MSRGLGDVYKRQVYVGPFRTKEDIDKNIEFIYEISQTDSGEVLLWKP